VQAESVWLPRISTSIYIARANHKQTNKHLKNKPIWEQVQMRGLLVTGTVASCCKLLWSLGAGRYYRVGTIVI
jgi:hypothetical protein